MLRSLNHNFLAIYDVDATLHGGGVDADTLEGVPLALGLLGAHAVDGVDGTLVEVEVVDVDFLAVGVLATGTGELNHPQAAHVLALVGEGRHGDVEAVPLAGGELSADEDVLVAIEVDGNLAEVNGPHVDMEVVHVGGIDVGAELPAVEGVVGEVHGLVVGCQGDALGEFPEHAPVFHRERKDEYHFSFGS